MESTRVRRSDSGPAVVLSPHLDDAVLSAWSVLRAPGPLLVVNVCTAIPPPLPVPRWDRLTGARDAAERMRERIEEDRRALALAGREPLNLDFLDCQYGGEAPSPDEVAAAVAAAVPEASALHAPAAIGGHADHVSVRAAALELAAASGVPLALYAEWPYAVRFGWPHWVTGQAPDPQRLPEVDWEGALGSIPGGAESLRPEVVHLTEGEAEAKLGAMRTYATQFTAMDAGDVHRLASPALLPHELRWHAGAQRRIPN